jgi:RHS repeat-associated protein
MRPGRSTYMRLTFLVVAVVFGAQAAADRPETLPPGMGKYILVLREPDRREPANSAPTKPDEPDVQQLGGSVVHVDGQRRVILLPIAAAQQLRAHARVGHLQRVWLGEAFETWTETGSASREPGLTTHAETDLTWSTGEFGYDSSGNIKRMGNDMYVYDTAGRLIQAVVNGTTETYRYDSFGNLTEKTTGASTRTMPVDPASNRLSGEVYDESGSVVTHGSEQGPITRFSYDSLGMVTVVHGEFPQWSRKRMIYTADDERIAVMSGSTGGELASSNRWTIRDFEGKVQRYFYSDASTSWEWMGDYVYAEGVLVGGERETDRGGILHFHLDHLGSTRMVTDQSRKRIGRHDYYPFGLEQTVSVQEGLDFGYVASSDRPEQMKFTGHQRDYFGLSNVENHDYLDYMHARHYDPGRGRFLSVDPGDDVSVREPQSWNKYAYVRNNPVNAADPTGMFGMSITISAPAPLILPQAREIFDDWNRWFWGLSTVQRLDRWHQQWTQRVENDRLRSANTFRVRHGQEPFMTYEQCLAEAAYMCDPDMLLPFVGGVRRSAFDRAAKLIAAARYTKQQQAVIALAKEAVRRGGVTKEEAMQLIKWAKEYGIPYQNHIGTNHWIGGAHIRIGNINHIKVH